MKKVDIANAISKEVGITKEQSAKAVDAMIAAMCGAFRQGECVYLRKFATFKPVTRKPRKSLNVQQQVMVQLPAYNTVKFIISKELKDSLN